MKFRVPLRCTGKRNVIKPSKPCPQVVSVPSIRYKMVSSVIRETFGVLLLWFSVSAIYGIIMSRVYIYDVRDSIICCETLLVVNPNAIMSRVPSSTFSLNSERNCEFCPRRYCREYIRSRRSLTQSLLNDGLIHFRNSQIIST